MGDTPIASATFVAESDPVAELEHALRRQAPRIVAPWLALVGLAAVLVVLTGFAFEALVVLGLFIVAAMASAAAAKNRIRRATALAEALRSRLLEVAPPGARRVVFALDPGLVLLPSARQLLFWMFFTKEGVPVRPLVGDLLLWTRTLRMFRIGFVVRDRGPDSARARLERLREVVGARRASAVFLRNRKSILGLTEPEWSAMGRFVGSSRGWSPDSVRLAIDDFARYFEETLRTFREAPPALVEAPSDRGPHWSPR